MNKKRHAVDPAAVKHLAKTYQIDEIALLKNLPGIGSAYLANKHFAEQEPTAKDTNQQLAKMRKAASDLRNKIGGEPTKITALIKGFVYTDLDKLNGMLAEFEQSITNINPKGWKKNSATVSRDDLICRLAKFWEQQTGKPADRSSKPGQFLSFMCECAYILGIDASPLPDRFAYLKKLKKL